MSYVILTHIGLFALFSTRGSNSYYTFIIVTCSFNLFFISMTCIISTGVGLFALFGTSGFFGYDLFVVVTESSLYFLCTISTTISFTSYVFIPTDFGTSRRFGIMTFFIMFKNWMTTVSNTPNVTRCPSKCISLE